ncbi:YhcB family protein [Thalassotalea litorea]|uniref:YhcB family protein n=1 Tax=Thalassotalea litorea TaxID=2020715 RepID=UPI0037363243
MDIIISLSIFVAGLVIGVIATRLMSSASQENQRLEKEVEESRSSLESYQQDVAVHLKSSMELLGQMNEACTKAMLQMEKSTDLLNKVNQETNGMPFFSAETEAELKAVASMQRRKKKVANLTEAPRDYSADPSGLFDK